MKREIILSIAVHILILAGALLSSPFSSANVIDYGDVIRVTLPSADQLPSVKPQPLGPVEIPRAVEEIEPEIPVSAPTTKPAVEISKPKDKPKPKPKPDKDKKKNLDADKGDQGQTGAKGGKIDVEGATDAGSPFAGATVDDASFNYPYWFIQAFNKIMGNHRPSVSYDGTLICTIHIQVIRSGRVIEVKVIQSSGIPAYDDACLAAIERSKPLPPLPGEFRDEIIGITIPMSWEPR